MEDERRDIEAREIVRARELPVDYPVHVAVAVGEDVSRPVVAVDPAQHGRTAFEQCAQAVGKAFERLDVGPLGAAPGERSDEQARGLKDRTLEQVAVYD